MPTRVATRSHANDSINKQCLSSHDVSPTKKLNNSDIVTGNS